MKSGNRWKKVLLPILGIGIVCVTGLALFAAGNGKEPAEKQIRTDAAPVYHHFPGLPESDTIQWCSRTSDGIGLTTVWLYVFAFYDHDVSAELGGAGTLDERPDFYFLPEGFVDDPAKWRKLDEPGDAFQAGIQPGEKMTVSVYLNEAGNVLYMEAAGD